MPGAGLQSRSGENEPHKQEASHGSVNKIRGRIIKGTAAAVFLLLFIAAAGGWLAYRAQDIAKELRAVEQLTPILEAQVASHNFKDANRTLDDIDAHIRSAREASEDSLWNLAGAIPIVGSNFIAVNQLAVAADDIVQGTARPLLKVTESVNWDQIAPVDGKLDIAAIRASAPSIKAASSTLALTHARLEAIDRSLLLPQVAAPLDRVTMELEDLHNTVSTVANVTNVLPRMMGSNEPRNYLILVQNSAELRATGGLPGALALITVNNGSVELTKQSSGSNIGKFSPPIEVEDTQVDIYSSRLGTYISDVNLTPDFPTAAKTAAAMWKAQHGDSVDGVVAIDPVVLEHILEASGPIALKSQGLNMADGSKVPSKLDSENVVATLLSDVYDAFDSNAAQDAFFAAASQQVFEALMSGQATGPALLGAIAQSVDENRLHVWSNRQEDQEVLVASRIGGRISGASVGSASFGVYFNDGTGAKMDYYMHRTVQLVQVCSNSEYSSYTVRVHTANSAPFDAATSLPPSVTGDGLHGVPAGTVRTNVVVYGPAWSHVDTTTSDGTKVSFGSYLHEHRPVGVTSTVLSPGQSSDIDMTFIKVVQDAKPTLVVTPTVQPVKDVNLGVQIGDCQ